MDEGSTDPPGIVDEHIVDEHIVEGHGTALAAAVEAALPGWVERSVRSRADADVDPDAVADAARRARQEVGAAVRALLEADVDQQWTTPLALLRGAVRYPTEVLAAAGVAPVERDPVQVDLYPDDVYDLSPASFGDIDPALAEPGMMWGAAKAYAHMRRHARPAWPERHAGPAWPERHARPAWPERRGGGREG